ncbi:MAG: trigger factor [Acidobacteria bacterium]|nr:trigger factor [Acidobacteriota bacterium]
MKTELIEVSEIEREIKIEIDAEAVRDVYNKVSQKYTKIANVPGFRKGFAPLDVVRLRYKEDIKNEVIRELLPNRVTEAIQEHGQMPLTEPDLHFENWETMKVNGTEALSLHIHFEVMPVIPTPEYKGAEAVRRVKPTADDEIDNLIEARRQDFASLIPVEGRKSKDGDTVIVDLTGTFVGGEEQEPIVLSDLEIKLGDDSIEKSFTDNLQGVEADDEKEFTVTYPEGFSAPSLSGKTVSYAATIKSVGTIELPEVDNDWAKSLDEGYKSLADLRKKLAKDLEAVAKSEADIRVRNDLINALIQKHGFPIPNALIESQARNLLDNFARDMQSRGFDLKNVEEDFIKMAYQQMRQQAEFDVRGAMLLEKIAELENIVITDDEVSEEIGKMAEYYGVTADEIRKQEGVESSISNTLRTRKAVEAVFENAKITDGEWRDPNQPVVEPEPEVEAKKTKKAASEGEKPKKKAAKKEK